jgi:hypothetical protein
MRAGHAETVGEGLNRRETLYNVPSLNRAVFQRFKTVKENYLSVFSADNTTSGNILCFGSYLYRLWCQPSLYTTSRGRRLGFIGGKPAISRAQAQGAPIFSQILSSIAIFSVGSYTLDLNHFSFFSSSGGDPPEPPLPSPELF